MGSTQSKHGLPALLVPVLLLAFTLSSSCAGNTRVVQLSQSDLASIQLGVAPLIRHELVYPDGWPKWLNAPKDFYTNSGRALLGRPYPMDTKLGDFSNRMELLGVVTSTPEETLARYELTLRRNCTNDEAGEFRDMRWLRGEAVINGQAGIVQVTASPVGSNPNWCVLDMRVLY